MDLTTTKLIELALAEDLGPGDITTNCLIEEKQQGAANLVAKETLVLCGISIAGDVFNIISPNTELECFYHDGDEIPQDGIIATVRGSLRAILSGERTSLNFLQRLSGISTKTKRVTDLVKDYDVAVLDTRKTTPGWRMLEKYAVRLGGGRNHRIGLFDEIMIKNNHLDAYQGNLTDAILACRKISEGKIRICAEVRNSSELAEALAGEPDQILLDNMSPDEVIEATKIVRGKEGQRNIVLEVSGGINESNILDYAATGVDALSMGSLTHSVVSSDISLHYLRE